MIGGSGCKPRWPTRRLGDTTRIKSLTLKQMAQYVLDLQRSDDLSFVLCSWADMLPRLKELAPSYTDDEGGVQGAQTRAFYAVRQIIDTDLEGKQ